MKIAFIGGSGHHAIRGILREAVDGAPPQVAVAGDGHDDDAARRLRAGIPGAAWFDDARKMLDAFKPDAASVGAVYAFNGDWVAESVARDIPVTSDKPIAATTGQLERLRDLVEQGPARRIVTEFSFRSDPAFRAARDAVARGSIGKVVLASGQKSYRFSAGVDFGPGARPAWYADRRTYGGTVLWVASHAIDAIRFTTGLRFVAACPGLQGNLSKPAYGSMEDHTVSLFELEGGAAAVVHADYLRPVRAATHGDDRIRLAGSAGVIEIRDERCRIVTHDAPEQDITDQARVEPIHREILAALRGERDDVYSTGASLEMAAVLLAARQAADARTRQPIDPGV